MTARASVRSATTARARALRALPSLAAALLLGACASPAERFAERVQAAGLAEEIVPGAAFDHLVVRKPGRAATALHVYVEGDGTPWRTRDVPADDPTPRRPLAFELMLRDPQAALYLGRPCYFGVAGPRCDALVWTHQRYSEAVVESMARALRAALERSDPSRERSGPPRILLIGHSGGGVLAVLLARRVPGVAAVVTIGANLDVARWAARHGYSPLAGSLDPARLPPATRDPPVPELDYIGSDDRVVLPAELREYARGRPGVEVIERPGFDHVCCWRDAWPGILATLPSP